VAPLPPADGVIVPDIAKPAGWTIVTVLPVVDVATEALLARADRPLVILTTEEMLLEEADIVIETVASTPLAITFELTPQTTHFRVPAVVVQETDLPAAVAAAPADMLTDEKSVEE
jgi:hypothetical protein